MMIKYSKDDRYDKTGIATHDHHVTSAYSCSSLGDVKDEAKDYGVIGIDEGQFVSCQSIRHVLYYKIFSFQILWNFVKKWLIVERQLL